MNTDYINNIDMNKLENNNTVWTYDMDEQLKLINNGINTCSQISKIMNICHKNIQRRINKLGLSVPPRGTTVLTEEQQCQLKQLIDAGTLLKNIAKIMNLKPRTISHFMNKNKFYINPKKDSSNWTPSEEQMLVDLNNNGRTIKDISRIIRKRTSSITEKLIELNLMRESTFRVLKNKELAITNMRHCWKCNITYPLQNFYNDKCVSGKAKTCKTCALNTSRNNRYLIQYDIPKLIRKKVWEAKHRAKKYNMDFNLTKDMVIDLFNKQEGKCYYTSHTLIGNILDPKSLSIDRKDSSKGYTIDNIVLCCKTVNYMKLALSMDNFKQWIIDIHTHFISNFN